MGDYDITSVKALQVIDSRGDPTVEVVIITEGGGVGRGIAPAGASKGRFEAIDLRDGGKAYRGRGVLRAVEAVNKYLAPAIMGMDTSRYRDVDRKIIEVDGTPNKSRLGANATTATSLAVINAAADTAGQPLFEFLGGKRARVLPTPLMNIINGGVHAGNELSIQEFMIVPVGADSFSEALRIAIEVYKELKEYLKEKYGLAAVNVGDEGGFAPPLKYTTEALEALIKSINRAGYDESHVVLALDAAASQFFRNGKYVIDGKELSSHELLNFYLDIISRYPIRSIEDPFSEEQPEMFKELRNRVKGKVLIIGDDLTVTRVDRVSNYFSNEFIDGAIIKINQVGTFSEAEDTIRYLLRNYGKAIISHRSGESEDVSIAHIAVAYETGLIKTGAPARGERTAKYNELLRIENYLGGEAEFLGIKALEK